MMRKRSTGKSRKKPRSVPRKRRRATRREKLRIKPVVDAAGEEAIGKAKASGAAGVGVVGTEAGIEAVTVEDSEEVVATVGTVVVVVVSTKESNPSAQDPKGETRSREERKSRREPK